LCRPPALLEAEVGLLEMPRKWEKLLAGDMFEHCVVSSCCCF
jgi:hypothetical protein